MSELNFTGNALKGSRAIVSFDAGFDTTPATALMKELLLQTFSVPKSARRVKPFIDRVLSFHWADGKVWVRHYQIVVTKATITDDSDEDEDMEKEEPTSKKGKKRQEEKTELTEIGPRFVMTPIVILEGSFGGPVVYENKEFVSPNAVRASIREKRAKSHGKREEQRTKRVIKRKELDHENKVRKAGEIDEAVLFA